MMQDTMCAGCGKYTHILSNPGTILYCNDSCKRMCGVPGKGEIKRELRCGEIVTKGHMYWNGDRVKSPYYLLGQPYPPDPITKVYTIEPKND